MRIKGKRQLWTSRYSPIEAPKLLVWGGVAVGFEYFFNVTIVRGKQEQLLGNDIFMYGVSKYLKVAGFPLNWGTVYYSQGSGDVTQIQNGIR